MSDIAARPVLISHSLCPYVQRAAIVLLEKEVAFDRVDIDLAAKPDWFLALSPLGKVPVLRTGGVALFESQAIVEYLDETTPGSLYPVAALERARHRAWIEAGSAALVTIARLYGAMDPEAFRKAHASLRAILDRLDPELALPFFSGERFHLVDGVWSTVFRYFNVFEAEAGVSLCAGLDRVETLRAAVAARPSVRNAAPVDYQAKLTRFLIRKAGHLAGLMGNRDSGRTGA